MLRLDVDKKGNIQNQVVKGILDLINTGNLKFGDILPSISAMSDSLLISRTSVIGAYEKLMKLGIIQSKERSGYFVSVDFDESHKTEQLDIDLLRAEKNAGKIKKNRVAFIDDVKIPDIFIRNFFMDSRLRQRDAPGDFDIKRTVTDLLLSMRRVKFENDASVITKNVVSLLLGIAVTIKERIVSPTVILEYPCHSKIHDVFTSLGFKTIFIPVDQDGLQIDAMENIQADCIYLTPAHQFPTGAVLSQERREFLSLWCQRNDAWLIEDDSWALMNLGKKMSSPMYMSHASPKNIYVSSLDVVLGSENSVTLSVLPDELFSYVTRFESLISGDDSLTTYRLISHYLNSNRVIRDFANLAQKRRKKYQLASEGVICAFGEGKIWGEPRSIYFSFSLPDHLTWDDVRSADALIPMADFFESLGFHWLDQRVVYPFASLEIEDIERINGKLLKLVNK